MTRWRADNTHRLLLRWWVLLLPLLAASGCAGGTPAGSSAVPAETDVRAVLAIRDLLNPPLLLVQAQARVTDACLIANGFRYLPYEVLVRVPDQPGQDLPGVVSLPVSAARADGYGGLIGNSGDTDPDRAQRKYTASLTPHARARYSRLLWGPQNARRVSIEILEGAKASASTLGCSAMGRRRVYGSVLNSLRVTYLAQGIFRFQTPSWRDADVQSSVSAYASCMRAEGYNVRYPLDAVELARDRFGTRPSMAPPSWAEVAQAVADGLCQERSQIVEKYEAALVKLASTWISESRDALITTAEIHRESIRRAQIILTSSQVWRSGGWLARPGIGE